MPQPQDAVAARPLSLTAPGAADLALWPTADPPPARTLIDILDTTVRRRPDAPALEAGGGVLTYRRLLDAADELATRLRGLGVGPGDRVGVRVPSGTTDLYVAILGVLRAGAAYVPVDMEDPDERAEMIWQDASVCAVVGEGCGIERGPGKAGRRPGAAAVGDDAWIIFTSGTTGRPKGVAVTHRAAAAFVDAEARLFLRHDPLRPGDRVLAGLSVAFDASCEEMWLAWRHGACLVPAPRSLVRAGADLGPWLVRHRITAVSTVPTLAALWPPEALDRIRLLIVGGEACPRELVERLDVPTREFWNTYGPTETTVVACASLMRAGQTVRIGTPLDGWALAVVDPQGTPVPWGETGELLIGGVGTARYLDGTKDAEKFASHPVLGERVYRSGDLVRAEPDGLVFVGRADEQVKLGGRRIELGEVDTALQALPGVRAAAAAVKETVAGGQLLVGYVVLEPFSGVAAPLTYRCRINAPRTSPPSRASTGTRPGNCCCIDCRPRWSRCSPSSKSCRRAPPARSIARPCLGLCPCPCHCPCPVGRAARRMPPHPSTAPRAGSPGNGRDCWASRSRRTATSSPWAAPASLPRS